LNIPTAVNDAILIPKSATFELQGKHFVFKVDAGNAVHNTPIDIMDAVTEKDYVVTNGVKSGDRIVTQGLENLKDGMKIKTTPSSAK
jgi:membrane fusion protein (multidrug efflux system)